MESRTPWREFPMKSPGSLWCDILNRFSQQSRCKSRSVGALVVKDEFLIAEGWNSAPRGSSCDDCRRSKCLGLSDLSGTYLDQAICAHAEANAIANCAKRGVATDGAELWVSCTPCSECAKLIVGAGIRKVTYLIEYPSPLSYQVFEKAKVECVLYQPG